MNSVYIGLGSNLLIPLEQINQGLAQLDKIPNTKLLATSPFYGSTAVGPGQQPDYINAVAKLETQLSPLELLDQLQTIEQSQGRQRGAQPWLARTLDLDILLFNQETINQAHLTIPHPRLESRNFVIQPLFDIAPELQLPNGKILAELQSEMCNNGLWPLRIPRYIAIEGPIGVGKTTLSHRLSQTFGADLILEQPADNPFLTNFYRDNKRWSLATQLYFLTQRTNQLTPLIQRSDNAPPLVADFFIQKDSLFAKLNLTNNELDLYQQISSLLPSLPKPDFLIYLRAPIPKLVERIQQRGIPREQCITGDYLQRLVSAYDGFFDTYCNSPAVVIDTGSVHLAESTHDYEKLVQYILTIDQGCHSFDPMAGTTRK